jgi:Asp-tRNA(Asn)/Glu-tRNA(Gln) amidotransferase A subunit family amidase
MLSLSRRVGAADSQAHGVAGRHRQAHLERIEALNDSLRAYLYIASDQALAAARLPRSIL